MTDRFYPVPAKAEPPHVTPGMGEKNVGAFNKAIHQTSYMTQNEMRTYTRSPFPPGYCGHQPGIRDKFGYGSPGPEPGVLMRPDSAPGLKAMAQTQREDNLSQLWESGPGSTGKSWQSQAPAVLKRSYSLPKIERKEGLAASTQQLLSGRRLNDEEKTYFVPESRMDWPKERVIASQKMLSGVDRSRPFTAGCGIGTGFNSQKPGVSWWPSGEMSCRTMYKDAFQEKPYHPKSGFLIS